MPTNTERNIIAKWKFIEIFKTKNTTRRVERFAFYWHSTGYASKSSLFWDVLLRILVASYRRFGTTYGSLLERSWTSLPLNVRLLVCPEKSVNNYQSMPHNVPEERRSHLRSDGSLKSCTGCFQLRMKSVHVPDISNAVNLRWHGRHLFCNWWSGVGSGWANEKT
jgi:hypothetical protein